MFISLHRLLNMFRATLCSSSGADDLEAFIRCVAEPWLCRQLDSVSCLSVHWEALNTLNYDARSTIHQNWSYCSWFDVCWSLGLVGLEWYLCCRLKHIPTQPHRNSNTHRSKNNTTNVVIQQNSRKLLMMDILMSETC